jgi:hypothetical protein
MKRLAMQSCAHTGNVHVEAPVPSFARLASRWHYTDEFLKALRILVVGRA